MENSSQQSAVGSRQLAAIGFETGGVYFCNQINCEENDTNKTKQQSQALNSA